MPEGLTERQLAAVDLPAMLASVGDDQRVYSDGAVAAAMILADMGAYPRSLGFLAEVVRRGGVAYTLGVSELMPSADQNAMVRGWLSAADAGTDATPAESFARDEAVARWLGAVAVILAVRRSVVG